MFTPGTKKSQFPGRKGQNQGREAPDSPSTPFVDSRLSEGLGPPRPATGTPAPWGSRLSVLARIPSPSRTHKGAEPVFVAEFPKAVRDAQVQQKFEFYGGIEKDLSLSWIVCGNQIFVWSFLQAPSSKKCIVLHIPTLSLSDDEADLGKHHWMISFVDWSKSSERSDKFGVVACCREQRVLIYWAVISSESISQPMVSLPNQSVDGVESASNFFNSLLTSPIPHHGHECIVLALSSDGELWRFCCSPVDISRERIFKENTVYAKSLVWCSQNEVSEKDEREFFLLTDHEIQCWKVLLECSGHVRKVWSHELIGIIKELDEKNHILLLDMQVDSSRRILKVLIATLFEDYTQYSLLTFQYRPGYSSSRERILEKKGPLHVLIPKGRIEDEEFLLSMRLRIGRNISGSVVILSKKGNASVANTHDRGSTELYQFELPWDAGKVLDASLFSSMGEVEGDDWVVLTEKAGIWAIPRKVEIIKEDFESQRSKAPNTNHHSAEDEESEALLGSLFQDFLITEKVDGVLEKLKKKGAFEKEGSMNVFTRVSQSIVDTLAKHWTSTKGSDLLSSAVYSSQLLDKQQKHKRFLQFLALSKCHEELSSRQRQSLLIILEHGEKLSSMIKLRELQNRIGQERSGGTESPSSPSLTESTSPLWDLIQLAGEKIRRSAILLMDRDNAEVFYSRVSYLEDLFYCFSHNLQFIIDGDRSPVNQIHRICEVSNVFTSVIFSAIQYRYDHHAWYPSPEELNHWNCRSVVRSGLWSIASLIIQLLGDARITDKTSKIDLSSCLERLSEVLLEGYNFSIAVKMEQGKDYKALLEEYCRRRDEILNALYKQMKDFADKKYQEISRGTEDLDLRRSILKESSGKLLEISKRHEGYQTLWNICFDLDNTELLRNLMRQSASPQGGFSYFVFEQLYRQQRCSTLLRLGEEFQEELFIFLQKHKELLWLHEIFLNQFSSASENLHSLGLSQDSTFFDPNHPKKELSLSDRRRLLNLSKIAGAAAGLDLVSDQKMQRLEADLRLLKLQEKITAQFEDGEDKQGFDKILHPGKLIELCLKKSNTQKSQPFEAFEVFALTSSSFRASNKSLLAECWMNAVDQDDWLEIHQESTVNGWADELILDVLKGTVLFQASQRCYGPHAEVYDGGFDDVLPLLREDVESSVESMSMKMGSSVEGILMQHRVFPDAGKLMVTALVMGRLGADAVMEGDLMTEV